MGAVAPLATAARQFIVASTVAPGLPALRSIASALDARPIKGGAMGAASVFPSDYVFCGTHDYAGAAKCYRYLYTSDAGNIHDGCGG